MISSQSNAWNLAAKSTSTVALKQTKASPQPKVSGANGSSTNLLADKLNAFADLGDAWSGLLGDKPIVENPIGFHPGPPPVDPGKPTNWKPIVVAPPANPGKPTNKLPRVKLPGNPGIPTNKLPRVKPPVANPIGVHPGPPTNWKPIAPGQPPVANPIGVHPGPPTNWKPIAPGQPPVGNPIGIHPPTKWNPIGIQPMPPANPGVPTNRLPKVVLPQ